MTHNTHDIAAGDTTINPDAEILTLTLHERSYRMYDTGGKISRSMRAGVPYEHGLLEEVYQRTKRGQFPGLAIDVGANIGNHTLWMNMICRLPVVAIEPITVPMLRANLALNNLTNSTEVTVLPYAVGAMASLLVHESKGQLRPWRGKADHPEDHPSIVKGVPLDSLDLRAVSLIKIDVEGMEADVLRGARRLLTRDRPVVYAEFWDLDKFDEIEQVLHPLGYRNTRVFEMGTPLGRWESL